MPYDVKVQCLGGYCDLKRVEDEPPPPAGTIFDDGDERRALESFLEKKRNNR